jgi:uncharacterized protein YndB with AHSA1/START domain
MPDILHRVGIKSSTHEVYKALSEENGLAGWWSKNVKASPTVGAVDQFSFGDRGFNDMKVVELVPRRARQVAVCRWSQGMDWHRADFRPKRGAELPLCSLPGFVGKSQSSLCTTAAPNGQRSCSS